MFGEKSHNQGWEGGSLKILFTDWAQTNTRYWLAGLNENIRTEKMAKVVAHLKCTYHRVRLGGGGNRVVGCGYNNFAATNPMADTVKCSITVTTDGTEHCACTAMHNVLLKWDPWDSLCGVGSWVGACGLGELSGVHKNPIQPSSSLQNIDNDIMKLKVWIDKISYVL